MKKILLVLLICVAINSGEKLFSTCNVIVSSLVRHAGAGEPRNCLQQCMGTAQTQLSSIEGIITAIQ